MKRHSCKCLIISIIAINGASNSRMNTLYLRQMAPVFISSVYSYPYAMVMTNVPNSYQEQILRQTQDFSIVGAAILGGLVLTILGFSVAYTHVLLGPIVALRRQVQSMKDGNYRTRNKLRKTDAAHQGLADDLNELSAILQHAQANNRTSQSA